MINGIFVGLAFFYGFLWGALSSSTLLGMIGWSLLLGAMGYAFIVFKWGSIGAKISLCVFALPIALPAFIYDELTRETQELIRTVASPWVGMPAFLFVTFLMAVQSTGKSPSAMLRRMLLGGAFGTTKWASFWPLAQAGMFKKGGLFLGEWRKWFFLRRDIYHNGEGHLFTIGGTGGGKSSGLVVPALLNLTEGSVIVTDPSGEISAMTMRHRATKGRVVLLNPFENDFTKGTGKDYPDTGFNPLSVLDPSSSSFKSDCDAIARLVMVTDRQDSGSYWNDEGAGFLSLVIAATLLYDDEDLHNLSFIYQRVRAQSDELTEWLEYIIEQGHPALKNEAEGYFNLITTAPAQWQGAIRKCATATARYAPSSPLGEHTKKNGFDAYDLKRENVTVYILAPSSKLPIALPWMNLLIGVFSSAIGAPGQARPVTLLIDEAPSLGFLPDLQFCMAQYRKVGLRVWLFTQTMSQMQAPELYGREGFEALFGLCSIKQFFMLDEPEAQAKLSELCGEKTARNVSDSVGGISAGDVGVKLLRPEDARNLRNWRQVIVKSGMRDPIKAKLVPYFKRPDWKKLVDDNPYRSGSKPPNLFAWIWNIDSDDPQYKSSEMLTFATQILGGCFLLSWVLFVLGYIAGYDVGDSLQPFLFIGFWGFLTVRTLDWVFFVWLPSKRKP